MRTNIKMKERFLSILLTIMLLVGMFPSNAYAKENDENNDLRAEIFELDSKGEKSFISGATFDYELYINDEKKDDGSLTSEGEDNVGLVDLASIFDSLKDSIIHEDAYILYSVSYDGYRKIENEKFEIENWTDCIDVQLEKEYTITPTVEGSGKIYYKGDSEEEWHDFNDEIKTVSSEKLNFKFEAVSEGTGFSDTKIGSITVDGVSRDFDDEHETVIEKLSFEKDTVIAAKFDGYYSVSVNVAEEDDKENLHVKIDGKSTDKLDLAENSTDHTIKLTAVEGYVINSVTVNDTVPEGFEQNIGEFTYNITSLDQNYNINVSIVKLYKVTVNYNSREGKVTIDGDDLNDNYPVGVVSGINSGTSIELEATPIEKDDKEKPYMIESITISSLKDQTVDGNEFDENGKFSPKENIYNFSNPFKISLDVKEDIEAEFSFAPFKYTTKVGEQVQGGTYSSAQDTVFYGGDAEYHIIPDNGFVVGSIKINDNDISSFGDRVEASFDSANGWISVKHLGVTANETLEVTFLQSVEINDPSVKIQYTPEDKPVRIDNSNDNYLLYVFKEGSSVSIVPTDNSAYGLFLNDAQYDFWWGGYYYTKTLTDPINITSDTIINTVYIEYDSLIYDYCFIKHTLDKPIKITFDKSAPITKLDDTQNYYSSDEVKLSLNVNDLVSTDTEGYTAEDRSSGLKNVNYKVTYSNVDPINTEDTPSTDFSTDIDIYEYDEEDENDCFNLDTDVIIDTAKYNYADVSVEVNAEDRAGKAAEPQTREFKICKSNPLITVKSSDENPVNDNHKVRTFTVVLTEPKPSSLSEVDDNIFNKTAKLLTVKCGDRDVSPKSIAWLPQSEDEKKKGIHTAVFTFGKDTEAMFKDQGSYTWEINYKNNVGLEPNEIKYLDSNDTEITDEAAVARFKSFVLDYEAPIGQIEYNTHHWKELLEKLTFGVFSNSEMTVEASATDNICGSEDIKISYYKDSVSTDLEELGYELPSLKEEELKTKTFQSAPIVVNRDETYVVYAKLEDKAGNVKYIATNGLIFDNTETSEDSSLITITSPNGNSGKYHNSDFTVTVKVDESADKTKTSYSGIRSVSYRILTDGVETESGDLFRSSGNTLTRDIVREVPISISSNDSDDVKLIITVTDNAGNEYSKTESYLINGTSPTVSIKFNGTTDRSKNGRGYFNANRTATITVVDRDSVFNGDKVKASVILSTYNGEAVEKEDYDKYIKFGDWKINENDNSIHSIDVTFITDGYYTWDFAPYTNDSGNTSEPYTFDKSQYPFDFVIDKEAPTGKVIYQSELWETLLTAITFGFFSNHEMTVTAAANDDLTEVTMSYYKQTFDDIASMPKESIAVLGKEVLEQKYQNGEFSSEPIKVSDEQTYVIIVRFEDEAGNVSFVSTDGLIYDSIENSNDSSLISFEPEAAHSNGYFNKDFSVKVTVDETATKTTHSYSGIKTAEYKVYCNDTVTQSGDLLENHKPVDGKLLRDFSETIKIETAEDKNNSNNVKLTVYVEDNAGNKYEKTIPFKVNVTRPSVDISFDNNSANRIEKEKLGEKDEDRGYFNKTRTATITFTDRSSTFVENKAKDSIKLIEAVDVNNNNIDNALEFGKWSHDGDKHTITVTFSKNARYRWELLPYTNDSGNVSKDPVFKDGTVTPMFFTVDMDDAPSAKISLNNDSWKDQPKDTYESSEFFAESGRALSFALFSMTNVSVAVTDVKDNFGNADVYYYKTDSKTELTREDLDKVEWKLFNDSELAKKGVSPNEQFVVYLKIVDYAGNYSYINSHGCIVTNDPGNIDIDVVTKPNDKGIYGSSSLDKGIEFSVTANVKASENQPYAGVKSIEYWLTNGTKESDHKNIFTFDVKFPVHDDLLPTVTRSFTIDKALMKEFNSCDTVLHVKAVDNAGNKSEKEQELDIDITAPKIKVDFDKKMNSGAHDGYYTSRKATVTVTERSHHFAPDKVSFVITAVDSAGNTVETPYTVSEWKTTKSKTSPDEDTHTATVTFAKDGNYTFDVSATDEAGNSTAGADYGKSENPQKFTVDTAAPIGSISLDSSSWSELFDDISKTLTFGIFKGSKINVKAAGTDKTSPFVIEYYISDKTTALSKKDLDSVKDWKPISELEAKGITPNQKAAVYLRLTDYAGNYSYINSNGAIADNVKTVISIKPEAANDNNAYGSSYNGKVKVDVSVKDENKYSGIKTVEYWTLDNGKESTHTTIFDIKKDLPNIENEDGYPTYDLLRSEFNSTIEIDQKAHNSTNTLLYVKAVDNAGNETTENVVLDIDVTAPSIKAEFSDKTNTNSRDGYYTSRKAKIVVTERANHFDPDKVKFLVIATDSEGNEVKTPYSVSAWENKTGKTPDEDTHIATVTFEKDGNYSFNVTFVDDAGNRSTAVDFGSSKDPQTFTVDTTAPEGTIKLDTHSWNYLFNEALKKLTFGIFKNSKIDVSAEVKDKTSPFIIEYYISDGTTELSKAELDEIDSSNWKDFSVLEKKGLRPNERDCVYLRLTDYAGNYSYINSNGAILDNVSSTIVITPEAPNSNNTYGKSYNGTVSVDVSVTDSEPYSGIKTVEYWTVDDGKESSHTTLYDITDEFPNIADEEGYPLHEALRSEFKTTVKIKQKDHNSSTTQLFVKAVDNAGNETVRNVMLDIDVTAPTIKAEFSETSNPNSRLSYYTSRKAEITITERSEHFDPYNVDFNITALDAEGNRVDPPYVVTTWQTKKGKTPDEDTHTASITFTRDANYTFDISFTDNAGNKSGTVDFGKSNHYRTFTVDTHSPFGTVKLDDHSWNYLFTEALQKLTFGIFKKTRIDASAKVSDLTSPFTVLYYMTDNTTVLSKSDLDALSDSAWKPFSELEKNGINPNAKASVYLKLIDFAGNYRYINTDGVVVDNVSSKIVIMPEKPNGKNVYGLSYNGVVKVNVDVTDAALYSGLKTVEYWTVDGGVESEHTFIYDIKNDFPNIENELGYPEYKDLKEKLSEVIKIDQAEHNSSDTKVYVKVVDNAGNTTTEFVSLDIDVTAPTIKVVYDETATAGAAEGYYNSRQATITVTERNNHFDPKNVKIDITSKDANGRDISDSWTLGEWKTTPNENVDMTTHTALVKFDKEANYTFNVSFVDNAGNSNQGIDVGSQKTPFKFTVDRTAPTAAITSRSDEGREVTWNSLVNPLTYGFWSSRAINTTATQNDAISPIMRVEYYMMTSKNAQDETSALSKNSLDAIRDWRSFNEITVDENKQFVIYLKITDNAGNYIYVSTNGLIVDDSHPLAESVAPEIRVSPEYPKNGIYNGDVNVDIEVVDPLVGGTYSGIKEITYSVFDRASANPNAATQSGVLYTFNGSNPAQSDLLERWTGSITISSDLNNSNDIQLVIYASDNAGNAGDSSQSTSKGYCIVSIDKTAPTISVSYNNNTADNNTYFNSDRVATITIVERNFDPDGVKATIVNNGGPAPVISGWSRSGGTLNGDDIVNTAEVRFSADGDYTFGIEYTDLAGNSAGDVTFEQGTIAQTAFTIDKTVPTISVSYNNNSAVNGNYFNADRTATIVVNEHNFDPSRVSVAVTASNDGSSASAPTLNGWTNSGDYHTATIIYDKDAFYSFDISVRDMASNNSADYAEENFFIDKTAPVVLISGVNNKSAIQGECTPKVRFSDTNFDLSGISLTLTGINRKNVNLEGTYTAIRNGQEFTFNDFAREKNVDDIYTLVGTIVDKAGNSARQQIQFSVNRFGSTYALSEETSDLNDSVTNSPVDVVLTETNANELGNIQITVFRDNETITLTENEDYKIDVKGGNGEWYQYTYTIYKKVFENDGVYNVTIHSEDEAGNVAENTLDTKDMKISFGVDRTPPTINVKNIESNETYAVDGIKVLFSASDNLKLRSIRVILDGNEVAQWAGDVLREMISSGEDFTFDIDGKSSKPHNVQVIAVDSAGNEMVENVENVLVTTDLGARYINQTKEDPGKTIFIPAAIGIAVLLLIIIIIAASRRKKKQS